MMNKQALIDLRDKVEAGAIEAGQGTGAFKALGFAQMSRASSAYQGSLDAAKALHEAVLPGWDWLASEEGSHGNFEPGPIALVCRAEAMTLDDVGFEGQADNPARAWLIAILEALIAEDIPND